MIKTNKKNHQKLSDFLIYFLKIISDLSLEPPKLCVVRVLWHLPPGVVHLHNLEIIIYICISLQ